MKLDRRLLTIFPFLNWLQGYTRQDLSKDFVAGLTVSVVLIPQGMAYAVLAGLPPVYGLYAAFLGTAAAALWGSSRHLSSGPVALVSFLTLTALVPLAEPESAKYIGLAILLAFIIGLIQLLMGVFKLGFVMNFISHSVIAGFTTAAAIIIAATQIPNLFGFTVVRHEAVFLNFYEIITSFSQTHLLTAVIGLVSMSIIILTKKRISKAFPAGLIVMTCGILISFVFDLESRGVTVIGPINAAMSFPSVPVLSFGDVITLLPQALIIAIVGFLEAYAISRSIAAKTKQRLDVNQELVGQGLGNLAASVFRGYPIAGSFSRTAVNHSAGAVSGVSSVFVSIFVLFAILFLTPLLYYLPRSILGAIVIAALVELIEFSKFRETFNLSKADGIVISVTFLIAFISKPDDAIFIGILISLILFLRKTISAEVFEMVFVMEEERFKRISPETRIKEFPNILIIRIDMSIFFGNAANISEKIRTFAARKGDALESVVINFSGVNYIDVSGSEVLEELFSDFNDRGIKVYSMYRKEQVRELLRKSGVQDRLNMLNDIKGFKKEFIIQKNRNFS